MKIGDQCPECGVAVIRQPSQFFWRGDTKDGALCLPCNALWPIDGEEIEPLKPTDGPMTMTLPGVRE